MKLDFDFENVSGFDFDFESDFENETENKNDFVCFFVKKIIGSSRPPYR